MEKLKDVLDLGHKISKLARKLKRKLVEVLDGSLIYRSDRKCKERAGKQEASRIDDRKKLSEVRNNPLLILPTRRREQRNTNSVSLAPGTFRHEVVMFRRKGGMAKGKVGRLPIVVVTFEDGEEGWMYVQRCGFRQDVDFGVERARSVSRWVVWRRT